MIILSNLLVRMGTALILPKNIRATWEALETYFFMLLPSCAWVLLLLISLQMKENQQTPAYLNYCTKLVSMRDRNSIIMLKARASRTNQYKIICIVRENRALYDHFFRDLVEKLRRTSSNFSFDREEKQRRYYYLIERSILFLFI